VYFREPRNGGKLADPESCTNRRKQKMNENSNGALIAAVVIVALVLGLFFGWLWGSSGPTNPPPKPERTEVTVEKTVPGPETTVTVKKPCKCPKPPKPPEKTLPETSGGEREKSLFGADEIDE
jgi:outer membrane biosynthesis protein TonB